jgi:hypothetical protein
MGMKPEILEYERNILAAMDVEAEWKELVGLRTVGSVGPNGFLSCYSLDGKSSHPCAAICINGDLRGCYTDRRPGHEGNSPPVIIFRKKADIDFGGSYWQARDHYAQKYGVKKPDVKGELEFRGETTPGQRFTYCDHKPGVSPQALLDCGAKAALYPDFIEDDQQKNRVLTFPFYWAEGDSLEPCGWHFVNQDPRRKIDQGSNRKQEKVLSRGRVGFLNKWAIEHWDTAEVVWLVEGISDTLAVQAIIDRSGKHVVTSSGGCGTTPWKKAIEKLTGKTVYVCFDVGDTKNEGQKGAAKWIKALTGVAAAVKNVVIPADKTGKYDLRDWIVSGKRTYADMLRLAEEANDSPVVKAEADSSSLKDEALSPEQKLLDRLGCVVCGIIQGTSFIEVYSTINCTNYTIKSLNGFSIHEATLAFGGKAVGEVISQEKDPPPNKVPIFVVRQAIATIASGNIINDQDSIGAGMWEVDGDVVLVGKASAHRYTPERQFHPIKSPLHRGRRIDFSGNIIWYDEDRIDDMLTAARDPRWRFRVVQDLLDIFGRWDNWELMSSIEVGAGLVLATWAQTLWSFRPHVCISGPSDCGKTTMIGTLMKGMFNGLCAAVQKSSAPGIRQKVRNTGMILAIDEFEEGAGRKEILELLRTSTRGGKVSLGNQSGKGQEYGLRHIAWVAGIEVGLTQEADRNRFISLDLNAVDKSNPDRKDFSLPGTAYLHELGERAMVTAMYSIREARAMAEQLNTAVKVQGLNSRYIEGFAVPAAMLAVNLGIDLPTICETVKGWIEERAIVENKITDEEVLVGRILTSKIGESGKMFTVESLLQACMADDYNSNFVFELDPNLRVSGPDANRMLEANGIKFYRNEQEVFIDPDAANRFLLANTNLRDKDLKQLLKRIKGAREGQRRVTVEQAAAGGTKNSSRRRGVFVPIESFI